MVVVVATNYSVSSRQGSRLLGLSPSTIPCLSLPDPCLSFTLHNKLECSVRKEENIQKIIPDTMISAPLNVS